MPKNDFRCRIRYRYFDLIVSLFRHIPTHSLHSFEAGKDGIDPWRRAANDTIPFFLVETVMSLVLHGYWRSSAAYRVRIGLNLKGVDYRQVTHDLRTGAQREPAYRALAPIGLVPALEADGQVLTQSMAILEWIEERHPDQPLLPRDAVARATVRAMASIVACDIHPLNNLRVLDVLRSEPGMGEDAVHGWIARWISDGFAALEAMASEHGHGFCFGDRPTIADCCLVPQLYNARRFAVDLDAFPTLLAIETNCGAIEAFARAKPEVQPDADSATA